MGQESKTASEYFQGVTLVTDPSWGDCGKGKIVDLGAQFSDIVVKTNGGANAGHTVCNEHGKFPLHLVPSGIFNPDALCIIGSGVVVDPIQFTEEYGGLLKKGIPLAQCLLAEDAHIVMPWHRVRDNLREKSLGNNRIGTTGRGIGPTYADRANREGFRLKDLQDPNFKMRFKVVLAYQERIIRAMDSDQVGDYFDPDEEWEKMYLAREITLPLITDTRTIINKKREEGKNILGEAGQGALLDPDLGSYPYTTSSHPGIIGMMLSTGFRSSDIDRVVGVTKAYTTRVGEGPMPTEQKNGIGDNLRSVGREVGVSTGRPRRCGWFDGVSAEYGARTAGITNIALTKLDILDGLDEIRVCVAYEVDGQVYRRIYNADAEFMSKVKPRYETLKGWEKPTKEIRCYKDLPKNTRIYIERIEEIMSLPIDIISVGPDREETIFRN